MEWPWDWARRRPDASVSAAVTEPVLPEPRSELERVVGWRTEVLVEAGYPLIAAANIACNLGVDLHRAVELIKGGCPLEVAVDILL